MMMTEVLADAENRFYLDGNGACTVAYKPNNLPAYYELQKIAKNAFKKASSVPLRSDIATFSST